MLKLKTIDQIKKDKINSLVGVDPIVFECVIMSNYKDKKNMKFLNTKIYNTKNEQNISKTIFDQSITVSFFEDNLRYEFTVNLLNSSLYITSKQERDGGYGTMITETKFVLDNVSVDLDIMKNYILNVVFVETNSAPIVRIFEIDKKDFSLVTRHIVYTAETLYNPNSVGKLVFNSSIVPQKKDITTIKKSFVTLPGFDVKYLVDNATAISGTIIDKEEIVFDEKDPNNIIKYNDNMDIIRAESGPYNTNQEYHEVFNSLRKIFYRNMLVGIEISYQNINLLDAKDGDILVVNGDLLCGIDVYIKDKDATKINRYNFIENKYTEIDHEGNITKEDVIDPKALSIFGEITFNKEDYADGGVVKCSMNIPLGNDKYFSYCYMLSDISESVYMVSDDFYSSLTKERNSENINYEVYKKNLIVKSNDASYIDNDISIELEKVKEPFTKDISKETYKAKTIKTSVFDINSGDSSLFVRDPWGIPTWAPISITDETIISN